MVVMEFIQIEFMTNNETIGYVFLTVVGLLFISMDKRIILKARWGTVNKRC